MTGLFSLAGRTAMVTGASRGLGRAIALGFAEAGASLVLAARDRAKLEETAEDIRAAGGQAQTIAPVRANAGIAFGVTWIACTAVKFSLKNPSLSSSATGVRPYSATHAETSAGCSATCMWTFRSSRFA